MLSQGDNKRPTSHLLGKLSWVCTNVEVIAMDALEPLKRAIAQLSPEELAEFRCWFAEFETQAEASAKLDRHAAEALRIKGKLLRLSSPQERLGYKQWFAGLGPEVTEESLDQYAAEALRIKGK
ncbi:MAG: hypothetical protein F6K42_15520 [Leptolyngbya sp. SIO1D8]|nr:hypothetical protein [Leptolyngbya sp. SIO1D8]